VRSNGFENSAEPAEKKGWKQGEALSKKKKQEQTAGRSSRGIVVQDANFILDLTS
jgi:hypothetical protein